jgi:hypothetical protein
MIKTAILFLGYTLPILGFLPGFYASAGSYSTSFTLTENPISEKGNWVCGQTAGNNLWGDVRTDGTMAFGVTEPTTYGDPTAVLTGAWGPDQTAQATVRITATPDNGCCHEAEIRLRTTIAPAAHTITGYEIYGSVTPGSAYCHIASWGGPNGSWANIENSAPSLYLKNGDVLKATVTGTNPVVVTAYLNGTQIMTVRDFGTFTFSDGKKYGPWTGGAPGVGFYDNTDDKWGYFGFSRFTVTDGASGIRAKNPPREAPAGRWSAGSAGRRYSIDGKDLGAGHTGTPGIYLIKDRRSGRLQKSFMGVK